MLVVVMVWRCFIVGFYCCGLWVWSFWGLLRLRFGVVIWAVLDAYGLSGPWLCVRMWIGWCVLILLRVLVVVVLVWCSYVCWFGIYVYKVCYFRV